MKPRLDFQKNPALKAMFELEGYLQRCGLDHGLLHLVKYRASQINGCAFCLDMHSKDARAEGESEQRLYAVSAWRETPFFSDRERAALEWTEALTRISENDVPDDLYERVRKQFSEEDLVNLTMAIVAINGWNRLAIPFRSVPGSYQRPAKPRTSVSSAPKS